MKKFMSEKERMNVLNEIMQDAMGAEDEEIEDDAVDNLINEVTTKEVNRRKREVEADV
jgi:hypothetical protein